MLHRSIDSSIDSNIIKFIQIIIFNNKNEYKFDLLVRMTNN